MENVKNPQWTGNPESGTPPDSEDWNCRVDKSGKTHQRICSFWGGEIGPSGNHAKIIFRWSGQKSPLDRRETPVASVLVTKSIVPCLRSTSRLSGGDHSSYKSGQRTKGWPPYGGGPFVPVPKKWLLAYQPVERKRRSVSDLVGKLYELDQLEFSFPPAGVFQTSKRR